MQLYERHAISKWCFFRGSPLKACWIRDDWIYPPRCTLDMDDVGLILREGKGETFDWDSHGSTVDITSYCIALVEYGFQRIQNRFLRHVEPTVLGWSYSVAPERVASVAETKLKPIRKWKRNPAALVTTQA